MRINRYLTFVIAALLIVGSLAVGFGGGSISASAAQSEDTTETPITGDALTRASAAALAHTGGGRVTETEVGDEDGYYEVEVTMSDGSQVDVHLDEQFIVIGQERDSEGSNDQDGTSEP